MDFEAIKGFISQIDFAMIGMIITAVICAFIILIHILRAKKHGLAFTIGTFLILAISIALAVIGSRILALLLGDQLLGLIKSLSPDTYEQVLAWVPSATEAGPAVFAMLVGPLLMPILFVIFRMILQFFAKLIRKIFAKPINRYEYGEDPAQAEKKAAKEQAKKEKAEKAAAEKAEKKAAKEQAKKEKAEKAAAEKAEKEKAREEKKAAQADSADQTESVTAQAPDGSSETQTAEGEEGASEEAAAADSPDGAEETSSGQSDEGEGKAEENPEEKPEEAKPEEPALTPAREPLNTEPVRRRRNPVAVLLAILLGAVCGCMVIVVLFSSAIGYQIVMNNLLMGLDTAADEASKTDLDSLTPDSQVSANDGMAIVKDITQTAKSITTVNVIDRTIFTCGGQVLFNLTSTYEFDGNRIRLMSESDVLGNVIRDASVFLNLETSDEKFTLTTEHAQAIKDVVTDMSASQLVPPIVAHIVASASTEWAAGKPYNDVSLPDLGENIQPSAVVVFSKLSETTKVTLNEDLTTIADVLYILIDNGVFNDPENITSILSKMGESGCLDDIFDVLEQNARMRVLVIEIENIALRSMSSMLGIRNDREDIYTTLIEDLVKSYNELYSVSDDAVVGFGKTVKSHFINAGLPLTDSMADTLAVSMLVEFGTNNITTSDMEQFFRNFAEDGGSTADLKGTGADIVYLSNEDEEGQPGRVTGRGSNWIKDMSVALMNKNENEVARLLFEAEDLFGYPLTQISENIMSNCTKDDNSTAPGFCSNLSQAGTIQSVLTTIRDLMHSDEQFAQSRAFSKFMVSSAKELTDLMDDDNASGDTDTRKMLASVGKTIDDLKKNGYDHAEELLLALIESDTMTDGIGMNPIETKSVGDKVNEEVRRSNVGYEILLPNMYDVVTAMMAIGDSASSKEETLENIQTMVTNLTPETARALAGIAETDLLSNIGIPEESMEGTTTVVSSLLNNLADAKEEGMSDDQIQRETDSINSLMQVSMSSIGDSDGAMFGDDSRTSMTADEFLSNVFGSEIVTNTIAESIQGENGETLSDPLNIGSVFTDEDIAVLMQAEDEGGYSDEQIQMLHTFLGILPEEADPEM